MWRYFATTLKGGVDNQFTQGQQEVALGLMLFGLAFTIAIPTITAIILKRKIKHKEQFSGSN